MTDTRHVADMIDAHLTAHAIPIAPTQRDRIADMIDHYVDVVHVNETETDVIDTLNTPDGLWEIASEIVDIECQCETAFTSTNPECIACHADIAGDLVIIGNHLTPILHQLLTT